MATEHTLARSLHDLGLAAWFGGALMGAVGVNVGVEAARSPSGRTRVANEAWDRWTPVNAVAIAAHLLGGLRLTQVNALRVVAQRGARGPVVAKVALTVAALGATAYARQQGRRLRDAGDVPAEDATTPQDGTPPDAASAQRQLTALQWAVPALTGALIVLSAKQGEQQRAGLAVRNVLDPEGIVRLARIGGGSWAALRLARRILR